MREGETEGGLMDAGKWRGRLTKEGLLKEEESRLLKALW